MSLRTRRACEDTVISCEKEGEVIDRHKLTLISCQTARKGALGGGGGPTGADVPSVLTLAPASDATPGAGVCVRPRLASGRARL